MTDPSGGSADLSAARLGELWRTIEELKRQIRERDELLAEYRRALDRHLGTPVSYKIVTAKEKVDRSIAILNTLYHVNGGYTSAMSGPYRALWLRDTLYCAIAREYVGDFESIKKTYGLAFDIFHKSGDKISSCIDDPPTAKTDFLHARYNPHTLQEFPEEWGHNQLDIFGLFLYKVGDLRQKGIVVYRDYKDLKLAQDLVWYLFSLDWDKAPDFGVWEEGPEVHASSVGAVLAGLRAAREHIAEIRVPGRFIAAGREALGRLLPRESQSRPYDLAQLSLLWPFRVVSPEQREQILSNIETHLVRERGVIRYPGDRYYNADPNRPDGNEAAWPMGFSWLSIVYTKIAEEDLAAGRRSDVIASFKKAHHYIKRTESAMVDGGAIPELYVGDKPNPNTPLTWAQAMYIVAVQSLENLKLSLDRVEMGGVAAEMEREGAG